MKVVSVVGARPQFVKLGAIHRAFATCEYIDHVIIHTGQHYDRDMSASFFDDLAIPTPDVNLGIGSGSHGQQTGRMLEELDPQLNRVKPDWTLVYGDTNSTAAASLAAVKLQLPLAHLEAGLRSFNRAMPEEHNRVVADHTADLLLAPSELAMRNLQAEGLERRSLMVGDVMVDVSYWVRDSINEYDRKCVTELVGSGEYVVATIHRPSNTDNPAQLSRILDSLRSLPMPVLLAVHPRLSAKAAEIGVSLDGGALVPSRPLPYRTMVAAVIGAAGVVTDSGGLQKEAFLLEVPCTTIRAETEWAETLDGGWNILDPAAEDLTTLAARPRPQRRGDHPYGDGNAAIRVSEALQRNLRG